MIDRPETRDYVRRVLAARQAYREMSPHADHP
jgi:soluble lytic murein transglycosylase-like protein